MDDVDRAYRDALAAHQRQLLRTSVSLLIGWHSLLWYSRVRDACRARDRWRLAGVGLAIGSSVLTPVSHSRRAELKAEQDLAREQHDHLLQVRAREFWARGEKPPRTAVTPPGTNLWGLTASFALLCGGWVQGIWDYAQRPGRDRSPTGTRWRWHPGPAGWTAWSWQQLPVNATSTAPRHAQIAYQRRQLVTQQATHIAAQLARTLPGQLLPGYRAREWLRVTAVMLATAASVTNAVQDYRRVPAKVDAQRARRRRHAAAIAALERAHTHGRPGPPNPWSLEITIVAAAATTTAVGLAQFLRCLRQRPKRPEKYRLPPVRKAPSTAGSDH